MYLKDCTKRAVCILLSLVMLIAAVGCGDDSSDSEGKKKVIVKRRKEVIVVEDEESSEEDIYVTEEDSSDEAASNQEATDSDEALEDSLEEESDKIRRERYQQEEEYVEVFEPEFTSKKAAWNLTKDYEIVYSSDVLYSEHHANTLKAFFEKNDGLTLSVVEDSKAKANSKKILVGDTKFHKCSLKENEYAVYLKGDNLVFAGGHFMMVECAVDWFTTLDRTKGYVNLLTGKVEDFVSTKTTEHGTYDLMWGDEFAGEGLDDNKWEANNKQTSPDNTFWKTYGAEPDFFNVSDGRLKLKGDRYYNDEYPQYEYAVGRAAYTKNRMNYLFGYAEMRARISLVRGFYTAWWLDGLHPYGEENLQDYFVEIDIFETFSRKNQLIPDIHKWYYNGDHSQYNGIGYRAANRFNFDSTENLNNEYHLYTLEWTPDYVIIGVDGEAYHTFDLNANYDSKSSMDTFRTQALEMLITATVVTSENANDPTQIVNNDDMPFYYYVDYVRIYQNKEVDGNKLWVRGADGNPVNLWAK